MTPPGSNRPLRALLTVLALAFATATLAYAGLWAWSTAKPGASVELGFDAEYEPARHALRVDSLTAAAPAERAGLRRGDRIVALDGAPLADADSQRRHWARRSAGDSVRLSIERAGEPAPLEVVGVFRRAEEGGSGSERFASRLLWLLPIPFVAVGLALLSLRLESPVVWIVAMLFAGFTAIPGVPESAFTLPGRAGALMRLYQQFAVSVVGPLFYTLFAVFPVRSPIDRRAPWLKWVAIALGLSMAVAALPGNALTLPPPLPALLGPGVASRAPFWFQFAFLLLGLAALLANRLTTRDAEVLRKIRVVFWGTIAGVGPNLMLAGLRQATGFNAPVWVDALVGVVVLAIFPLSFAYAILKHRVLDLPVLLQRSARYLLVQRGFGVLLSVGSILLTVLFALAFTRWLRLPPDAQQPVGIALGAAFGMLLLWGGTRVHRHVGARIDRAFFRSAYDARQILEDLARRSALATGRTELASMLEAHLREALQPSALSVFVRDADGSLLAMGRPAPGAPASLAADTPGLPELARSGHCWEAANAGPDDAIARSPLSALTPECVAPVTGRAGTPIGLLVLGPRLSEEPYSGEDKRLLMSVASQSSIALENIHMAEEIAGRMEAEKRAAREIGIARDVQGRLLPQSVPQLRSLELAAHCIQARSVGGDYYDFLELGPQQVGLVLADVSGKGIQAALLMANLQAHLRSQSGISPQDPLRALRQVNEMLRRSTASGHFATLFLGVYSDTSRKLSFVNCGHNAPICLRTDGRVEMLEATATVLGAFEEWGCTLGRTQLAPGDLLVAYSDGITEASRGSELYGEERLLQVVRDSARLPAEEIAAAILASVGAFGDGEQSDDLTLMVARAR